VQESQHKFMAAVRKDDMEKVSRFTDKGLDPNFIDVESGGGPSSQSCPWVGLTHGLGWVGLGRDFSVFGGLGWAHYRKSTKNLKGLC